MQGLPFEWGAGRSRHRSREGLVPPLPAHRPFPLLNLTVAWDPSARKGLGVFQEEIGSGFDLKPTISSFQRNQFTSRLTDRLDKRGESRREGGMSVSDYT